jgi:NAD(P)H-hydrate epimerase
MVRPVKTWDCVLEEKMDVLALGPGIGGDLDDTRRDAVLRLIREWPKPMVIDADGLNILSGALSALRDAAGPRLLTPHPGEMKRLDPEMPEDRREAVEGFIQRYSATLVLKGSRTLIGERGQPLRYNSTGGPGMATGGMGDVLTGTIAALLGAGLSRRDAASVAVWICGRAAEIAVYQAKESPESLLPLDTLKHFGQAFSDARRGIY